MRVSFAQFQPHAKKKRRKRKTGKNISSGIRAISDKMKASQGEKVGEKGRQRKFGTSGGDGGKEGFMEAQKSGREVKWGEKREREREREAGESDRKLREKTMEAIGEDRIDLFEGR
ncbi:hypothetical protein ASPBRDRAFT_41158 [Aspergillus brasiliensis CBS 101740]|uniref:Uncharacterized protein n=1 Tax=Aspergillus brasiliensis (strain CBS 101740 / IMI 381727 / IBT 21946) TaxID=767769 RepID=A0A1L9UPA6_ASPBC|nr:hypothetical protein ASPBRDRAFT_41158 [Aspergillus brasiliensis CBS 101740]